MYTSQSEHGRAQYGVKEYVFDSQSDFETYLKTPVNPRTMPGSTAFIIATSDIYMLNNQYQWIKIYASSSSSSSSDSGSGSSSGGESGDSSSSDTDVNVTVNGGDIDGD